MTARVRVVSCVLAMLVALNAQAEWEYELSPGLSVHAGLRAGFAAVSMDNANLGLGQVDYRTRERANDPSWSETAIEPIVGFSSSGGWYGQASVVGAATFFDGDPLGFTHGGDGSFDLETAYLGWRSAAPEDDMQRPAIDLSVGRQTMDIGDGFLIDDGNFDLGNEGGVWLVPRQAFQRTLRARIDYRAVHADLFFLEADPDNDEPALAGTNLEYQFLNGGHLGLLYAHILDTDRPRLFAAREGMDVLSVRINDLRFAALPQVAWWGEATREFGAGRYGSFSASAWYGEGIYTFERLPWRPRLSYRYAYFSGDGQTTDTRRRDFDPLFYGFDKRSWGTWFQGEVTGGWLLFNNNQRNHLLHLAASPSARVTVGLIGGTFELAKGNYRGVPVSKRHFADELNVYTDWIVHKTLTLSAAYGFMLPGAGAVQAIGDDRTVHLLELGLYFVY